MERRPGVSYRRPGGDPDRFAVEAADEPRLSVDEFPRTGWLQVVAEPDRNRLRAACTGDSVDVTYRLTVNEEPIWVHERGARTEGGDIVGYLFPAGERVERRQRLEQQRERLDEFASVVSHDLRNPLSVAVGNIELARNFEGAAADDRLDRAHDALDYMNDLISDLLALAREGQSVEETTAAELDAVVERAWRTVGDASRAALIVDDPLPTVDCDRCRLRQAIENLFRNAIEHGADDTDAVPSDSDAVPSGDSRSTGVADDIAPGTFSVETDPETSRGDETGRRETPDRERTDGEPSVRIFVGPLTDGFYVADDGPGIDPDERERVFEPGHTTDDDGTGFGLAIVERIAEAHGWEVSVTESRTGGARFEFSGVDAEVPEDAVAADSRLSDSTSD